MILYCNVVTFLILANSYYSLHSVCSYRNSLQSSTLVSLLQVTLQLYSTLVYLRSTLQLCTEMTVHTGCNVLYKNDCISCTYMEDTWSSTVIYCKYRVNYTILLHYSRISVVLRDYSKMRQEDCSAVTHYGGNKFGYM